MIRSANVAQGRGSSTGKAYRRASAASRGAYSTSYGLNPAQCTMHDEELATKVRCMPARDVYHDTVKHALIVDGWAITHDPLRLAWGLKDMYIDLGAEQLVGAERAGRKIAVEIKSFLGPSQMDDLEKAVGQYLVYHDV